MRKIFTLLFSLFSIMAICQPQIAKEVDYYKTMPKPDPNKKIVFRCAAGSSKNTDKKPVLIIDGVLCEYNAITKIKPNDIESITVFKQNKFSALFNCYSAANGLILITTKSAQLRKFNIKDFLDGKPIPGASVKFKSLDRKDSLSLIANDSGLVVTNKLKPGIEYDIEVSSIGFDNYHSKYKLTSAKESIILLGRKINLLSEVIVTALETNRRTRCYCCCWRIIYDCFLVSDPLQNTKSKIYPNPVQRGSNFNVELPTTISPISSSYIIRIFSLSGALVHQQKVDGAKLKTINVASDNRWTAGTYIVQVVNNAGKQSGQHKLIIQ